MGDRQASEPHLSAEYLTRSIAARHGFRAEDYVLVWDDGDFDPARPIHALAIATRDGRRAMVDIPADALARDNPWTYFPRLETALAALGRRSSNRGAYVEPKPVSRSTRTSLDSARASGSEPLE